MADKLAKSRYSVNYRGYTITHKQDFGDKPFLIDGLSCDFGFNVIKDGCNATPGAGWFLTVKDAKLGIDCLLEAEGDADRFHVLYRTAKTAQAFAPELLAALEKIKAAQAWVLIEGARPDPKDVEIYRIANEALMAAAGPVKNPGDLVS